MITKLSSAFFLLRQSLEKRGGSGVLGTTANLARAIDKAGKGASEFLKSRGHGGLAMAARIAPHAAVAYGAKKGYESETSQRVRMKYRNWKMRRAMKRAQRQQRY